MSKVLKKIPCPACGSKDNLVVYSDGGLHCFGVDCGYTVLGEEYRLEHGLLDQVYEHEEEGNTLMFQDKWNQIKNKTRTEGKGFRGIRDDIYAKFGVRHEYHTVLQSGEETEELVAQYYPLTTTVDDDTQVCGVKVRQIPKKFRAEGLNKKDKTHLFGQVNFLNSLSKTVVIFSGEIDLLSGYQMLFDALGNDQCPAVVSGTCGEGAVEQYSAQYEFLNKFDKIVIVPDADEAGKKALKKAVQALPKDKVYVLEVPQVYKDPNAMLMAGKEKDFITLYFRAKPYVPDGIVGSGELYNSLLEMSSVKKIPLPPFLHELEEMTSGGFSLETIVNVIAASGLGKCLGKGTLVRMHDFSLKKVEDVVIGDKLLRPDGKYNTVVALSSGIDTLYKVKQNYGIDYVVNSNHVLSLKVAKSTKFEGKIPGEIVNIPIKEFLKQSPYVQTNVLKGWRASFENLEEVEVKDFSTASAYLLGYWLGDGNSGDPRITIHSKEVEILDRLKDCCKVLGLEYTLKSYPSRSEGILTFTPLSFRSLLSKYNLLNNKHIPDVFFKAPRSIKLSLLAGILDSDGYKGFPNTYEISFKSLKLMESLRTLCLSLGLRVSTKETKKSAHKDHTGTYYRSIISGFKEILPCAAPRKINSLDKEFYDKTISGVTVEEIGEGAYFGFELDGDHLFCLEDCTVTHNSTYVNELIYFWLYNSPYKVGIVSMELSAGQYANALFSRHVHKKLSLLTPEQTVEYLESEEARIKGTELFKTEDGSDRFYIIEDRSSKLDVMKDLIEELVIGCGCKIIVIDPLHDIFSGCSLEQQELHMTWQKVMVKTYGVCIVNINHTRKSANTKESGSFGNMVSEEDIAGSSTIYKSASLNIILTRNKMAEDILTRNMTQVYLSKNRQSGITGPAGCIYYDNETHTLHNEESYRQLRPELFIEDQEFDSSKVNY